MGDNLGPYFSRSTFAPLEVLLSEGNVEVYDVRENNFLVISKVRGPGVPYYELEVELHDSGLPEHLQLVFVDGTNRTVTRELRVEQFSEKFGYVFPTSFTLTLGSRSQGKFEIDPESITIVNRPRRDMFRLDTTEGEWAHFENAPKTIFEKED